MQYTVLYKPVFNERHINSPSGSSRAEIERTRCPQQCNSISCVVSVEGRLLQEWLYILRKFKLLIIIWQWLLALWRKHKLAISVGRNQETYIHSLIKPFNF